MIFLLDEIESRHRLFSGSDRDFFALGSPEDFLEFYASAFVIPSLLMAEVYQPIRHIASDFMFFNCKIDPYILIHLT